MRNDEKNNEGALADKLLREFAQNSFISSTYSCETLDQCEKVIRAVRYRIKNRVFYTGKVKATKQGKNICFISVSLSKE